MSLGYSDFTGSYNQTDVRDLVFSSAVNPSTNKQNFYIEGSYQITEWRLKSITIPLSFYLFREGINDGLIVEEDGPDGAVLEIAITAGNYTPSQLCSRLKTALNDLSDYEYDVLYSSTSGKVLISCPDNQFRVLRASTASYELGITEDSDFTNNWVSNQTTDFSGCSMIHLSCPNLATKSDLIGSNKRIIASIPISQPTGSVEVYREGDGEFYRINSHLSNIEFQFLDDYLRPLDFQNKNFVVVLTVKVKV